MTAEDAKISIIIGITGHRTLRECDVPAVAESVRSELLRIRSAYASSPVLLMTNMAEGADQLCAGIASELGIGCIAALPFPADEHRKDFQGEALYRYEDMLKHAALVFPVCETYDPATDRDQYYLAAGRYLVDHSHVILSLYDGEPPKSICGTAAITQYAIDCDRPVIRVVTPSTAEKKHPGRIKKIGNWTNAPEQLMHTELFNERVDSLPKNHLDKLIEAESSDPIMTRIQLQYGSADRISCDLASKFQHILTFLAVLGSIFTLAFLLYDEMELHWLVFFCGIILVMSAVCLLYAKNSRIHKDFLEYRVLAECLRVQGYLRYAGSETEVQTLIPWTQRHDTPWIQDALATVQIGPKATVKNEIRHKWIESQRDYHLRAEKKNEAAKKRSDMILRIAVVLSILFYLAALIFELFIAGSMPYESAEKFRTVIKIGVGTFSAATLFIANFYGKMSVSRQSDDNRKMSAFYNYVLSNWETLSKEDGFLEKLASEELIENGNWYSYRLDDAPDLVL